VTEDKDIVTGAGITATADGVTTVAAGEQTAVDDTEIEIEEETARAFVFDTGVELSDIVDAINAVGAGASDLVEILAALREAGALRAEIIII
jgi:flagellar P-ring protein precursor FlgI